MAEYFAGGHLRFLEGEWRDDDGNVVEIIKIPYKPFPVVLAEDENNSDVFCPFCDTNLSGHYYGGDYESPKIIPCFECGTWLDGTKAITKEEAETLIKRSCF